MKCMLGLLTVGEKMTNLSECDFKQLNEISEDPAFYVPSHMQSTAFFLFVAFLLHLYDSALHGIEEELIIIEKGPEIFFLLCLYTQ